MLRTTIVHHNPSSLMRGKPSVATSHPLARDKSPCGSRGRAGPALAWGGGGSARWLRRAAGAALQGPGLGREGSFPQTHGSPVSLPWQWKPEEGGKGG